MRALHIITGLGVGGAEQQLRSLLRHLPLRCEVITLTNPGPVAEQLRADGIPVTHLGMAGNRDLAALPRLVRAVRAGRYDVVHTHLYRACVYGRIAARLAGVRRVVATEHSLGDRRIEGRPLTRSTRALYLATERLGTATVAVSSAVAGRLRHWGVPADRIHLVPNGIETARFRYDPAARRATRARLGLDGTAPVVGGLGRLVPGKRFDVLVRAVAQLPDAVLVLAGAGPEHEALRRLAGRLGVADRVRLIGECAGPEVPDLLSALDVFVSTSQEETFGLAVLEALAAGLPVLYTTCPALEELPPGHAPGARRIGSGVAATADALRAELTRGATRLPRPAAVDHYDITRAADRLMTVYGGVR
jgi:glycosyltransferase involved in cell wall biosynthesis